MPLIRFPSLGGGSNVALEGAAQVAPSAPGLTLGTPTTTTIPFTITAPSSGNYLAFLVNYRITGSPNFTASVLTLALAGTLTGLVQGTSYDAEVIAYNLAGAHTSAIVTASTVSEAATITTPTGSFTSGAPITVNGSVTNASTLWISASTGGAEQGARVQATVTGSTWSGAVTPLTAGSYTISAYAAATGGMALATTATITVAAGVAYAVQYTGVNLSGAENNPTPVWAPASKFTYWASKGANMIRYPMDWAQVQPTLNGALASGYMVNVDTAVASAAAAGQVIVIELHNYGSYNGNQIGTASVPNAAFANVWGLLAVRYAGNSNVWFGLQNEPAQTNGPAWIVSCQGAIAAIQAAPANNTIVVPNCFGDQASGAGNYNFPAALKAALTTAQMAQCVMEIHQYFDTNQSGTAATVTSATVGVEYIGHVTAQARLAAIKLLLGEFGAGTSATALACLQGVMQYCQNNADVWLGWTLWGAGDFGSSYPLVIEPIGGVDQPQTALLTAFAAGGSNRGAYATEAAFTLSYSNNGSNTATFDSTNGLTNGYAAVSAEILQPDACSFIVLAKVLAWANSGALETMVSTHGGFQLTLNQTGTLQYGLNPSGGGGTVYGVGSRVIAIGSTIVAMCIINENGSGNTNFYLGINGTTPTLELTYAGLPVVANNVGYIGATQGQSGWNWLGSLQRTAILYQNTYNQAAAFPVPGQANLAALWDFRQGATTGSV